MAEIMAESQERDVDSDEEIPQLSDYAQSALQEFYAEQKARQRQLECRLAAKKSHGEMIVSEDWQLSQFWYDESTALKLAEEALNGGNKRIACVSCPTLYAKLLQLKPAGCETVLFEYDRRFERLYGDDFVYYDYTKPLVLPEKISEKYFDIVVADPPYLSEECLRKMSETVKFLTSGKILLCTGAVMEDLAREYLSLKVCSFIPRHTRNLANEFRCFVNYDTKLLNSQ